MKSIPATIWVCKYFAAFWAINLLVLAQKVLNANFHELYVPIFSCKITRKQIRPCHKRSRSTILHGKVNPRSSFEQSCWYSNTRCLMPSFKATDPQILQELILYAHNNMLSCDLKCLNNLLFPTKNLEAVYEIWLQLA